eukprot:SAG11_NODE_9443_length_911_cov_0.687192_2_plen_55_part_01
MCVRMCAISKKSTCDSQRNHHGCNFGEGPQAIKGIVVLIVDLRGRVRPSVETQSI